MASSGKTNLKEMVKNSFILPNSFFDFNPTLPLPSRTGALLEIRQENRK